MRESSAVDQVRAAVDVVQVISRYVNVKKAGRTFKALCPFHTEKTPSFVIFPETGRWHCFGCGEGGDAFTFVMKMDNLTFPEALRQLAEGVGIPISENRGRPEARQEKDRSIAANEAAAIYFHGLLLNSASAREYVAKRSLTDETVRKFLLGLAPSSDDALRRHLVGQGFTEDELLQAGLCLKTEEGTIRDRYRGRLIFPIRDLKGQIVSFGGRALSADVAAKYLNGPATEIFDKGGTLFCLDKATAAIKSEKKAVVVEGYVDAVIAHQAGFENVVATLGTSITDRQLRQLSRYAPEICLALDADAAGQTAALRVSEVGAEALAGVQLGTWRSLVGFERAAITVALLPDGMDPDELILLDPSRWQELIAGAGPLVDQAISWIAARHDLTTAAGKRDAVDEVAPRLMAISDPISRGHYLEVAALRLHVDPRNLSERIRAAPRAQAAHPVASDVAAPALGRPSPNRKVQAYAVALLTNAAHRGLPLTEFEPSNFSDPALRALLLKVQELLRSEARRDWRPDLLELSGEPWLEEAIESIREEMPAIDRLSDAEVAAESFSISLDLREAREALEHRDAHTIAEDPENEDPAQVKALIAARAAARASLMRQRGSANRMRPWRAIVGPDEVGG
ncbi:MAG TPA: DNA primase [Chloroflexota bacterium]